MNNEFKKDAHVRKLWLIPIVAFVVVAITFYQLATAYNTTRDNMFQRWYQSDNEASSIEMTDATDEVTEASDAPMVIGYDIYDLSSLSRELQEITVALHYEMIIEMMTDYFDPLVDIARIPHDLDRYGEWEYFYEDDWLYVDLPNMSEEAVIDFANRLLFNRVSDARSRLSVLSSAYQISYLALHDNGDEITSGHRGLHMLLNDGFGIELIDELREQFMHVIVIRYNDHGRWEVPFLLANETEHAIHNYIDWNGGWVDGIGLSRRISGVTSLTYQFDIQNTPDDMLEWQNPRNMTFVYGIPYDAFYQLVPTSRLPQTGGFGNATRHNEFEDMYWGIRSQVRSVRTIAFWLMVGLAFIIPLSKIKGIDKGYVKIRKVPFELVAFGAYLAWIFTVNGINEIAHDIAHSRGLLTRMVFSDQNIRVIFFHGLLFVALCLLGYLVHYVKDIYVSGWETLRDDSLIYKLCAGVLAVDLKRSQSLRIFILVFGQILVGFGLLLLANEIDRWNPEPWITIFVLLYLLAVFLYLRHKVAKIRKDYMRLFEITQELADGNLEASIEDNLGYFDSLKDELVTIQNGLGYAVERALSSERMKGDLITNVSHDLKTPLTSIITYVDLLKTDGLSDEKRSQYLETLDLKTDRLKTLIEDLFEVTKASSGNLKLDMREVDVVTLMKQTVLGLEDRISEAGLVLRENYPEESVKMELDGGRMHRVFENLIINMVKYAMPSTRAYIDIFDSDDNVKIILRNISNHEIDIDMNDLSERFVRGEESRTTEGSGLGLAIAKSFVELQGGIFEITVDGDLFKVIMTFEK